MQCLEGQDLLAQSGLGRWTLERSHCCPPSLPGTDGWERRSSFSEDREDGVNVVVITDPGQAAVALFSRARKGFGGAEPATGGSSPGAAPPG